MLMVPIIDVMSPGLWADFEFCPFNASESDRTNLRNLRQLFLGVGSAELRSFTISNLILILRGHPLEYLIEAFTKTRRMKFDTQLTPMVL